MISDDDDDDDNNVDEDDEDDDDDDPEVNWLINVYTSNIKNAGTNANVHIQIFGTKHATSLIPLGGKENNDEDLFEPGNCDSFQVNLPDIGNPSKIKIGHDNKGMLAGWHLDKVFN